MNIRDDDQVSAVALVVESEAQTAAQVLEDNGDAPVLDEPVATTDEAPPTDEAEPESE